MQNNEILSFEEMVDIVSTRIDDTKRELEKVWTEFSDMCESSYRTYQTSEGNADLRAKAQEIVELIATSQRNRRLIDELTLKEQERRLAELELEFMSLHFEKDGSEREVDQNERARYYTEKERILRKYVIKK